MSQAVGGQRVIHHRGIAWWTSVLFMIGSACFALASVPAVARVVSPAVIGVTYFVGSLFFTTAGYLQFRQTLADRTTDLPWFGIVRGSLDWWAAAIQSIGTLWFNINTFEAMRTGFDVREENLRIWTPDFIGSICFLVASVLAVLAVKEGWWPRERDRLWWVAMINLAGSVFFMLAAIAAFVRPSTTDLLDAALANSGTLLGAVCFFWAAALLLRPPAPA